jgi:glucokinase
MFLGIEIGGTKLQLGVGQGDSAELIALERRVIDPRRGAAGILEQIESATTALLQKHPVTRIGIGFGGPVDAVSGKAVKSHQVPGWDGFPLVAWCRDAFNLPAVIGNDCDVAAIAEARYGAGQNAGSVFYVTVGTGIGGGFVVQGKLHGAGRPAASEIGHLRPGLHADQPEMTVESLAAGPGIAALAIARVTGQSKPLEMLRRSGPIDRHHLRQQIADARQTDAEYLADLVNRASGDPEAITAPLVAQAAAEGNAVACEVLEHALQALGWAIAQVITLLAPEVVVVGGGVSLIGEQFFFGPLREEVGRYVFPPLAGSFRLAPAELGELVVVHGAIALARG